MQKSLAPDAPWERLALASGIVAALLQLAAFVFFGVAAAPSMPPLDAPAAEHAAFYTDHWATLNVANYLFLLPIPFFLVLLGGLFPALRTAEGGSDVLSLTTIGAGVALAMTWPHGIVVAHTGQGLARYGLDPAVVVAFDGVAQHALALSGFPRAVFLFGAALLLARATGSRWLGWTGLGLAAVALAGTATLVVAEVYVVAALGTVLFDLWLLVVSGLLLRREVRRVELLQRGNTCHSPIEEARLPAPRPAKGGGHTRRRAEAARSRPR